MLFELLASTMISADTSLLAAAEKEQNKPTQVQQKTVAKDNYTYSFKLPDKNRTKYKEYQEIVKEYTPQAEEVIKDFTDRSLHSGQFLRWTVLPDEQTYVKINTSHLDKIIEQAQTLALRKLTINRPLVVLGIGGSKHTAEFLLNMTGYDRKMDVYFYSDIDPVSYENFLKESKVGIQNLNFLVVSKSGTTFETSDAFKRFENDLIKYYEGQGLSTPEAVKKAQSHFAICTDMNATDKNLRGKIGSKNNVDNAYLKELYIHDDVGGRYSMFDDAGLFVLAYSGVSKDTILRILNGVKTANIKCINYKNISQNPAMMGAIFNVFSRENGYKIIQQQYFGKLFEGAGENWAKQLYLESLKDFDFVIGKAPDSMHYATEGHFSPANRTKYNTIMTITDPKVSYNYDKYTGAIAETYSETTPLKTEVLAVENGAIKPEAIGEYIQSKHYETIYTGMLRRAVNDIQISHRSPLPEVLQPSVETYKNKFKTGKYELHPGE